MLSERLVKALCEQTTAEFHSAYLYLGLSAALEKLDYTGMAAWLRAHASEELVHGEKLYDYLLKRDAAIALGTIPAPPVQVNNPFDAFKAAYAHEQGQTKRLNALAKIASEENDFTTLSMLNWFLDEQVEEEDLVRRIVDRLNLADNEVSNLFLIDESLKHPAPAPTSAPTA